MSTWLVISLGACGGKSESAGSDSPVSESIENSQETVVEPETETENKEVDEEVSAPKQIIVYYPNWYLNSKPAGEGGEVGSIAWESVTMINHAFFEPFPDDGSTQSSWDQKAAGLEARTKFKCISTDPESDFYDETKSAFNDYPRNHFKQYEIYAKEYPGVKIMISVGGWTKSGFFSEMSTTEEGRKSFIASCVDLMKQYPFISGIDIDWEYPAGSPDGQRYPESETDEGCPIWSSPADDNANFTSLLKEMRETFEVEFGPGVKLMTACASSSTGWTLPCQDWVSYEPYLDYINIMTYDLAGKWAGVTGHHSPENLTKSAMAYFFTKKIDKEKLNIGSPMYPLWLKMAGEEVPKYVVNAPIDITADMTLPVSDTTHTQKFEKESVTGYTYYVENGICVKGDLYNNDPDSPFYMWFATYENPLSLQRKLDLIEHYNLAGIIVWESTQDTADHMMVNRMSEGLNER